MITMIQQGTHTYGMDPGEPRLRTEHDRRAMAGEVPWALGGNPTREEAEVQRAQARRATVPTLDTLMAEVPMVALPDGALVSPIMASRGDRGWLDDGDRDSTQAALLAELVRDMDTSVAAWLSDSDPSLEETERIMGLWRAIRRITQGNQGEGS